MTMIKLTRRFRNVSLAIFALTATTMLTFNCAPSFFKAATGGVADFSSAIGSDVYEKRDTPIVLMNAEQTFETMLNVTGQSFQPSNTQRQEYATRFASLSSDDNITGISSALMIASTSLAGEMCNGVMTAERNGTVPRRLFPNVVFTAAPNPTQYAESVSAMAQAFWGRDLNEEERVSLETYYNGFVQGATANADLTNDLYLTTCSAMLSAFDAITF